MAGRLCWQPLQAVLFHAKIQAAYKTLEDMGVKEIEALGVEFNPDYHNAVMHCEDDSLGENIIAEVLQKGYTYKESVVRHSMVSVSI